MIGKRVDWRIGGSQNLKIEALEQRAGQELRSAQLLQDERC